MSPYIHQQSLANKTLYWMRMDSEERFKLHQEKYPDKMLEWENYEVTYKFNSNGFRSDEFVNNNFLFFGCSFTLGEGVSVNDRWTKIVSEKLEMIENNLGVNGGSGDTCFRLINYWVPKLTPKHVFILYPFKHRREEFKNDKVYQLFPIPNLAEFEFIKSKNNDETFKQNFDQELFSHHIDSWLSSNENIELNYIKNVLSIENICQKYNSKLTIICVDDITDKLKTMDLARDLAHPGIEAHKYIANLFLEKMD